MCGVIVVDAGRSRSTCHGRDAYIHDHCLRYRHNCALFYQLLDSNCLTHRMFSFKREASSETYGPRVYLLSYLLSIYFICIFTFCIYLIKYQKYIYLIILSLLDLTFASGHEGIALVASSQFICVGAWDF